MARVNVYLPDDLAARVQKAEVNVSAVARAALEAELARGATDAWLTRLKSRNPITTSPGSVIAALDSARNEYDSP